MFFDKPEIREILGDSISYLNAEIKNVEFVKALTINTEVNVETVIKTIRNLIETKSNDKKRFDKLYLFLNENYKGNEDQINKYFRDENLIFIPEIPNEYIPSKKAIWKDVSSIFGNYRHYLEKYYRELKDFFVKQIGIPEIPTAKDYADILIQISEKVFFEKTDAGKILKIYKELNKFLKKERSENPLITKEDWWEIFVSKNIIWTNKSKFWRNDNNVFVNDDDEIYELFKNNTEVAFLEIPQDENTAFAPFIKEIGIKYLSKKVKTKIPSVDYDFDEKLTKKISELSIFLFRYLYHKENSIYEMAKEDGKLLDLINLCCYGVLELNVEYRLHTEYASKDDVLFLDKDKLYVKIDDLENDERISIELSKMFGSPKGLGDFIETLFSKSSNEKCEESLKVKKIGNLPNEEKVWFEKNITQSLKVEKTLSDSGYVESFDEEKAQDNNAVGEENRKIIDNLNKSLNDESEIEINEPETNSITLSKPTGILPTHQTEQSQNINEPDSEQKNWKPQIEPSEVEIIISEPVIPEIKIPSNEVDESKQIRQSNFSSLVQERNQSVKNNLSQDAKINIGKWGEDYAVNFLRKKFLEKYKNSKCEETTVGFNVSANNQLIVEVKWLNKNGDIGIGRDIEYVENDEKYYLEVKTTYLDEKGLIQISKSEWQLAEEKQDRYSIFRVYNAGTNLARYKEIVNPHKMWLEGRMSFRSIWLEL